MMSRDTYALVLLALFAFTCLKVAHLSSLLPDIVEHEQRPISEPLLEQTRSTLKPVIEDNSTQKPLRGTNSTQLKPKLTTAAAQTNSTSTEHNAIAHNASDASTSNQTSTTIASDDGQQGATTPSDDDDDDSDDGIPATPQPNKDLPPNSPDGRPPASATQPPSDGNPQQATPQTPNVPNGVNQQNEQSRASNMELTVLLYSVFIVYVSFIKLIYHNVGIIKRSVTEPAMLMVFGIVWELIARCFRNSHDVTPRFNSRIFFYLFLPSTVLESASTLSNKWLFINMLPILMHSIVGTLLFSASLGATLYSLSRQNLFNMSPRTVAPVFDTSSNATSIWNADAQQGNSDNRVTQVDFNNLMLNDCLLFGTILSSIDSNTMLSVFSILQVNDKLYYLALGESLMNNAVVLVVFNLLLDFSQQESRLTVSKIYLSIIYFVLTIIGSMLIGLLLACVALVSVRLTKRFRVPSALTSYQNQLQAMVETLLVLKLAYLSYTIAGLAGTSSIVSLATFGILEDQYIKHNLNLRSQLTFRQVILATKTMGASLVYPLLGMLLVDVAHTNEFLYTWLAQNSTIIASASEPSLRAAMGTGQSMYITDVMQSEQSVASQQLANLHAQTNLYWNFKFLALVIMFTLTYRFIIMFGVSGLCNLCTSAALRIRYREQAMLAYGGLKGPLAVALAQRLIEHRDEYRERSVRNKHFFMYTILFITFLSTLVKGSFIRSLVHRLRLIVHPSVAPSAAPLSSANPSATGSLLRPIDGDNSGGNATVFGEINSHLTEYARHGLNSVLGYSKSPYDKFADFNEFHIKPWLSREGANTNWLNVFYDNLVLDETLNSNSFQPVGFPYPMNNGRSQRRRRRMAELDAGAHLADIGSQERTDAPEQEYSAGLTSRESRTREPSLQSYWLMLEQQDRARRQSTHHNERRQTVTRESPQSHHITMTEPIDAPLSIPTDPIASSSRPDATSPPPHDLHNTDTHDAVLREIVLFDLKLADEARRQPRQRRTRIAPARQWSSTAPEDNDSETMANFARARRRPAHSQRRLAAQIHTNDDPRATIERPRETLIPQPVANRPKHRTHSQRVRNIREDAAARHAQRTYQRAVEPQY